MANDSTRWDFTFDSNLVLKDAGLVAASGRWKVNNAAMWIDVGLANFTGVGVADVSALEIGTGDEKYVLTIQGALRDPTSTPSNPVPLAGSLENLIELDLGAAAVRNGGALASVVGQYLLPFRNVQADVLYPLIGGYTTVSGTVATGINFACYIGKGWK